VGPSALNFKVTDNAWARQESSVREIKIALKIRTMLMKKTEARIKQPQLLLDIPFRSSYRGIRMEAKDERSYLGWSWRLYGS
jgi:hypothetical protein